MSPVQLFSSVTGAVPRAVADISGLASAHLAPGTRHLAPGTWHLALPLPARLAHPGDLPVERHLPEADAAEPELAHEGAGAAAAVAAVVRPDAELRLALALLDQGLACHDLVPGSRS